MKKYTILAELNVFSDKSKYDVTVDLWSKLVEHGYQPTEIKVKDETPANVPADVSNSTTELSGSATTVSNQPKD